MRLKNPCCDRSVLKENEIDEELSLSNTTVITLEINEESNSEFCSLRCAHHQILIKKNFWNTRVHQIFETKMIKFHVGSLHADG